MGEIRALSIMQPWLGAIVLGDKRVENRTWPAPPWIRGEMIALHAGKRFDWGAEFPPGRNLMWYAPEDLPLGAITGVATVAGCHLSPDFGGTCGASSHPLAPPSCSRTAFSTSSGSRHSPSMPRQGTGLASGRTSARIQ